MKIITYFKNYLGKVSFAKTIYYNYFSPNVIRENSGKLLIYKNTHITLAKGAKIKIGGGTLHLGYNGTFRKTRSSFLSIEPNGSLTSNGSVTIHSGFDICIKGDGNFNICDRSFINGNAVIRCHRLISIGEGVITGTGLTIIDGSGHTLNGEDLLHDIILGNKIWLGVNVTILGGKIGSGTVIGACALVTGDLPSNSLCYGIPCKVKKENITWDY